MTYSDIVSICVASASLLCSLGCLVYAIIASHTAHNDLVETSLKNQVELNINHLNKINYIEQLFDDNIGGIKFFIYNCQSVSQNQPSDLSAIKEADKSICRGFTHLRATGLMLSNQRIVDMCSFNTNNSSIEEDEILAVCLCSLTDKYVRTTQSGNLNKDSVEVYLDFFLRLYELLYFNLNVFLNCDEEKYLSFRKEIKKLYKEATEKGAI